MPGADREVMARLGRFLVVGGTGVVVNNAVLFTGYQLLRFPLIVASTVAVALSIANNFVLNDRWTFERRQPQGWAQRFLRFGLVSLGGVALTLLTLWTLVTYLGVHYLVANLVGIGLASGSSFLAHLKWTWHEAGSGDR